MPTKIPGVSHAMLGKPGDIERWLQIDTRSLTKFGSLLGGPMVLSTLSTMMQQRALQQRMDEIVDYLEEISEKVDDIIRGKKDAVLSDMIGVDLVIEDALTVRDQVGHVSDVTWSKVQQTAMTIARTQAYALRQIDAIAEKLEKRGDLGDIAKATREAEPKVREWLAVLARTFQLQDGVSVLELDRVQDDSPDKLDDHRLGLQVARRNRLDLITRSTALLLAKMDETVRSANSKVLFNPFDSPAAVHSSNQVASDVRVFRERLGIDSGREATDAKRWRQAAQEVRDKALATAVDGVGTVRRFGTETLGQATQAFREVDIDGDGIPDKPRALAAVEDAGSAVRGVVASSSNVVGSLLRRRPKGAAANDAPTPQESDAPSGD
jgi:hypothetical protein